MRLGPRGLDVVEGRGIERPIATEAQIGPACSDQGLEFGQDKSLRQGRRDDGKIAGKPIALGGVEDREALQKRNCVRLIALFARAGTLLVGDEPVGENHGRAALAFAHIAAHAQRLAKCQPVWPGKPCCTTAPQQDEHVDARIAVLGGSVLRHGQRRLNRRRAPRLHLWQPPSFQLGDDLVGDILIEARPVLAGASAYGGM